MNEEELKEPTEPIQTEVVVEQSDLDLIMALPVFGQLENIDSNTTEMLTELQKLNEYLILKPEEKNELQGSEIPTLEEVPVIEQTEETEVPLEEETEETTEELTEETTEELTEETTEEITTEEVTEEEVIVDYDPLILEQLEILNAHMMEEKELLEESNIIGVETAWLLVITVVMAIGAKVLVDQLTKW